ncbi:MAG: 3-deoxy-manno-octulosonate cytidylyltransferase [Bacteroidia bacterium]|nr:MAG: 3-deoxy-manno-octulosonate cytidylyltransferase [Bacteroidia bacterium]
MRFLGIIPVRYKSTRFTGKPLVDIAGKSMLQRVFEQARKCNLLQDVIVATDDDLIFQHAQSLGAKVIMTSEHHPSGTDRCFEAYTKLNKEYDVIINIQGDEPFIDPSQIELLIKSFKKNDEIATLMIRCKTQEELFNEGEVKIVLDKNNYALYFSRSVIPYLKNVPKEEWHQKHDYFRHVGMYAYRTDILESITQLPPSTLEQKESLEQLRWLENGYKILCIETQHDSHCIDYPEDIERVLKLLGYPKDI